MKMWIVVAAAALVLTGCARIPNYQSAVKTPPPASLVGNWQSMGPQKGLVSKEATATLIITAQGDTLDCRQWQRVIAKPGKITKFSGDWVNVNNQVRVMPLTLEGAKLHYDKLVLQRVQQPTAECQSALEHVNDEPAERPGHTAEEQPHRKSTLKSSTL